MIRGKDRRNLEKKLQEALNFVKDWATRYSLKLSAKKTQLLVLNKNGKTMKRLPSVKIEDQAVPNAAQLKYLGVIFSRNQRWMAHLNKLKEESQNKIINLSKVAARNWGVNGQLLKYWYTTVYEKSLLYANAIWGHKLNKSEIKKLNSLQRPYLLKITRTYKTTSTKALNVLAGIPPLDLQVKYFNKITRLTQIQEETTINGKKYEPREIQCKQPITYLHPADKTSKNINIKETITSLLTEQEGIYTDGSKTQQGVGAAWVHLKDSRIIETWQGNTKKRK